MKKSLLLLFLSFSITTQLMAEEDWGKTGHRVIGEIASQYISSKTERAINKLLDGQSLALVSNFGDDIKSDSQYDYLGPWHYVNFPFGERYEDSPKSEKGDLIHGIQYSIQVLKDDNKSK